MTEQLLQVSLRIADLNAHIGGGGSGQVIGWVNSMTMGVLMGTPEVFGSNACRRGAPCTTVSSSGAGIGTVGMGGAGGASDT
ncbi:MAG: hypothetical protein PVS2B1_18860 [Candidatus Dormibacteraceae bacterium]